MTTEFKDYINGIANEIITLSRHLGNEIETWHDVVTRVPDSTNKSVSAGFISKPTATSGIEIVNDIQAPPVEQTARLRLWAIETLKDGEGNERFNNIQLTYRLDYEKAHALVEQADALTHDYLALLAHDNVNQLDNIVVSDLTGLDAETKQQLGKRYDVKSGELDALSKDLCDELKQVISTVLERLQKTAIKVKL